VVDALTGQARQVSDLLLRDTEVAVGARIELRVAERGQTASSWPTRASTTRAEAATADVSLAALDRALGFII